jgi:hypothetical protein
MFVLSIHPAMSQDGHEGVGTRKDVSAKLDCGEPGKQFIPKIGEPFKGPFPVPVELPTHLGMLLDVSTRL